MIFYNIDKHTDVRNIDDDFVNKVTYNVSLKRLMLSGAVGLMVGCALNKAFKLGCETSVATTSNRYNKYIKDELKFVKTETSEENKADNN